MTDEKRLYALFNGDRQISKAHSTVYAVRIEAAQNRLVSQAGGRMFWPEGWDVREVASTQPGATYHCAERKSPPLRKS